MSSDSQEKLLVKLEPVSPTTSEDKHPLNNTEHSRSRATTKLEQNSKQTHKERLRHKRPYPKRTDKSKSTAAVTVIQQLSTDGTTTTPQRKHKAKHKTVPATGNQDTLIPNSQNDRSRHATTSLNAGAVSTCEADKVDGHDDMTPGREKSKSPDVFGMVLRINNQAVKQEPEVQEFLSEESSAESIETELSSISENAVSLYSYETLKSKVKTGEVKITNSKGRSKVWNVFGKMENSAGIVIPNLVACRKCLNIYKYNMRSTSNLVRHKCYIRSVNESEDSPKIDVEAETKKLGVVVFAKWILQNCRPLRILQDAGLMKVAEFLISVGAKYGKNVDIQKVLPHPSTISRSIESIYRTHYEKLKYELDLIKNIGFGLSADIWTDNFLKKNYLAVTIHYILNGKLFCRLLGMRSMEGQIFAHDLVAMKVSNLLQEFNCEFNDKVIIVTDMERNMIAAFRDKNRINCVNNLLHNTMLKALQEVDDVAELCNISTKLVKYIKVSGLNACLQSTLTSVSPTRWNTIYYELTSIFKNWEEITKVLREKNELNRINQINKNLLSEIIKVLEPFEETFKKLEGETYPTIHLTFLYIYRLKNKCSVLSEDFDVTKKLKEILNNYLDSMVIQHLSIYHKLAIFLFPPTNKLFQFNETEKNNIKEKCIDLMQNYIAEDSCNIVRKETSRLSTLHSELLEGFAQQSAIVTPDNQISKEMQMYANLNISFFDDFEVIQWWESRKVELPLLYKVSCRLLAVPVTSATSKRIFSIAGSVLSEKQYFNDTLTNEIMFLHSNLNEKLIASNLENEAQL